MTNILLYLKLLGLMLLSGVVSATEECDKLNLKHELDDIRGLNLSNRSHLALIFADSILIDLYDSKLQDCPSALWISFERAHSLELQMKFQRALDVYYSIIKTAEDIPLWELVAESYISMARCHEFMGRAQDCKRNLDIGKEIIESHDLDKILGRYYVRFSSYHRIFASRDTARLAAQQAIHYGEKHEVWRSQVDGHLLAGILAEESEKAIPHFRHIIREYNLKSNLETAAFMHINIVRVFLDEKNYPAANSELDSILKYIPHLNEESQGYHSVMAYYSEQKSQFFEREEQLDSALYYLKKYQILSQKAEWEVDQEKVNKNAVAFAVDKEKEKTIQLERASKTQRIWLLLMGLMGAMLGLLLLNRSQKQSQITLQNDVITERNNELNQSLHRQSLLLSEVHHRVKNNLQLVISLLINENGINADESQPNLADISNKVRSIALIHELLYQEGEFDKINIKEYINSLILHYKELNLNKEFVNFIMDIEDIHLNIDTVLPIGIICSELLNNSIKHAVLPQQKLTIELLINFTDNLYELIYKDNGPGYSNQSLTTSKKPIGMKLIHNMVRQLLGDSSISNEEGAVFRMTFREKVVSQI